MNKIDYCTFSANCKQAGTCWADAAGESNLCAAKIPATGNDHPDTPILYYEAHITIEPVFDERLTHASALAQVYAFRIADLLMQKRKEDTAERSKHDTFMTGRHKSYRVLLERMSSLVQHLQQQQYKVWRYKIEATVIDSKHGDALNILTPEISNTQLQAG